MGVVSAAMWEGYDAQSRQICARLRGVPSTTGGRRLTVIGEEFHDAFVAAREAAYDAADGSSTGT